MFARVLFSRITLQDATGIRFTYEGFSNMNESSFITFFTDMLRQNVIPFWKELFVAFKMAPDIIKNSHYIARVTDPYIKAIPVY